MTEKPSYFEDNYAAKFLTGKTVFPPDGRIFHRPEFSYDSVAELGEACQEEQRLAVALRYRSGALGQLSIEPVRPGILRLHLGKAGAQPAEASPMLLPFPEERPALTFEPLEAALRVQYEGYTLEIDRSPFCLRVHSPQGELIFESEWEKIVDMDTAPALGLRRPLDASIEQPVGTEQPVGAFLSWRIRNGEHCFGLGEKFNKFEKTGTRSTIWSADTCGSTTSDMSYKAVPVIFSTAGWALMLHSSCRSYWELGSFSYATGGLLVEEDQLDLFLILAPSLKEQVIAYTALTGRPSLPPRWAFGLWMSRAPYQNRAQMLEVAERLRAEEIPCDVFNIDPTWMEHDYYQDIGVEVCNFNWNTPAWGTPQSLTRQFADLGFGICLWINPYLSEDSPLYAEARAKDYLVHTLEGSLARLEFGLAAGIVDFTNPAAKSWWQSHLIALLHQGVSTFKVDFGDRVPEDALFYNRQTGSEMHNLYPHLYAQAVYEAVEQVHGKGIIWRRPGYIGTQRYPGCWSGDSQVTWEGMAGVLRGGLSAAFNGETFWSHDIGGFVGQPPSEELYIRWMQFGLLSPFARFHGITPREPWVFGERALEVAKQYSRLRYHLLPYLLACANESITSGLPILRPLVMEFQNEPRIETVDDQYLLGPDLLAAPVLSPGVHSRVIYLPKGQWWAFDRPGSTISGPGYREVDAPLERMPLFVRAGAVIPRYRLAPPHLKGEAPKEWQLDIYPGDSQRHLVIEEPGYTVTIDYHCENGHGQIQVSPAPITLSVRLIDRSPTFMRAGSATLRPGEGGINFIVDASQGLQIAFRA